MSRSWNDPQTSEDLATIPEHEYGHDRLHGDNPIPGVSSTIAMMEDNDHVEIEITARQKAISAMSGSLFTSLLGR